MASIGVLGLVGGLVGAAGTLVGGIAQYQASQYQSQVAANNALIAQQYAATTGEAAQQQAAISAMQEAEAGAKVKTNFAAGNVDVNTGSARNVETSQRELGVLDTATVISNAQLKEYGYKVEAAGQQAQSQLYAYQGPMQLAGGALGAGGQALGAAAKWYTPSGTPSSNPFG